MQNQSGGGQTTATSAGSTMSTAPQAAAGNYAQQSYGAYQAPSGGLLLLFFSFNIWSFNFNNFFGLCLFTGYYGGQGPQSGAPPVPQGQYGFPNYGYSGQGSGGQEN